WHARARAGNRGKAHRVERDGFGDGDRAERSGSERVRGGHGVSMRRIANRTARGMILACALWSGSALALDPALDVSQYGQPAWRIRDGFLKGIISALAQTPDGYLWLGAEFGLVRFDGVRTVPWQPPPGAALPDNYIFALLAARDGTLWIGTWGGLASWSG